MGIELVKRISWANRRYLPWNDVDAFNEFRVNGLGITFGEFKKTGYITVPPQYKKYEKNGFDTPSGKVEIYSTIFKEFGYDE